MLRISYMCMLLAALFAPLAIAACSDDEPLLSPAVTELAPSGASESLQPTPSPTPAQDTAVVAPAPLANFDCQVGQILMPQERCTYPGTSDEFWVDESGDGHFLFFTASTVINAQNANINNQSYDFAASKQSDGSWIIETAGSPSDSVKVSDLMAIASPSPTAVSSLHPQGLPAASPTPTLGTAVNTPTPIPSPTLISVSAPVVTPEPTAESSVAVSSIAVTVVSPSVPTATPTEVAVASGAAKIGANRPPDIVEGIGSQTVMVYQSLVMDVSDAFADPEGEPVQQYSVIVGNPAVAHAWINSISGELTLSGLRVGSTWITLGACDSLICTELGALNFLLTVTPPPNSPPQAVQGVADQVVRVGETLTVPVLQAFWDLEGDRVSDFDSELSNEAAALATINRSSGRMTFLGMQTGTTLVSVLACDNEGCGGGELALNFNLTVLPPVNKPPFAITGIADKALHVGEIITLDVSTLFADPEGDPLQEFGFSVTDRSVAVGSIDSRTGLLTIRGAKAGRTYVAVDASDEALESIRPDLTFQVSVTEPPRNPPRVISKVSDQTVNLGSSVEVSVADSFVTPSRYRVTWYDFLMRDPEIGIDSEISRDGTLTLKGTEEGRSWVSVRACSYVGCSNFSDLSFVLIVTDPDREPNRSPEVVGAVPDRHLRVGEMVTMDVSSAFNDPDDEPIDDYEFSFSHPYRALGSSITNTGVLTIRGANPGTTQVYISACDDENDCSDPEEMSFTLTVEDPLAKIHKETSDGL